MVELAATREVGQPGPQPRQLVPTQGVHLLQSGEGRSDGTLRECDRSATCPLCPAHLLHEAVQDKEETLNQGELKRLVHWFFSLSGLREEGLGLDRVSGEGGRCTHTSTQRLLYCLHSNWCKRAPSCHAGRPLEGQRSPGMSVTVATHAWAPLGSVPALEASYEQSAGRRHWGLPLAARQGNGGWG